MEGTYRQKKLAVHVTRRNFDHVLQRLQRNAESESILNCLGYWRSMKTKANPCFVLFPRTLVGVRPHLCTQELIRKQMLAFKSSHALSFESSCISCTHRLIFHQTRCGNLCWNLSRIRAEDSPYLRKYESMVTDHQVKDHDPISSQNSIHRIVFTPQNCIESHHRVARIVKDHHPFVLSHWNERPSP